MPNVFDVDLALDVDIFIKLRYAYRPHAIEEVATFLVALDATPDRDGPVEEDHVPKDTIAQDVSNACASTDSHVDVSIQLHVVSS
jgi:hypothetical protein